MKETERRGDRWEEATGVEQTEIDAIASLRPELLERLARQALDAHIDPDLDRRAAELRAQWEQEADRALDDDRVGPRPDARRRRGGTGRGAATPGRGAGGPRRSACGRRLSCLALPEVPLRVAPGDGEPLISSEWPWKQQTLALIRHKRYGEDS